MLLVSNLHPVSQDAYSVTTDNDVSLLVNIRDTEQMTFVLFLMMFIFFIPDLKIEKKSCFLPQ